MTGWINCPNRRLRMNRLKYPVHPAYPVKIFHHFCLFVVPVAQGVRVLTFSLYKIICHCEAAFFAAEAIPYYPC
jgi:hypothetical protein